jgi:two-component system, LytTR family, response regulator
MIRCVIIDDEYDAREKLKNLLSFHCEGVLVLDEADSVETGRAVIEKHKPDLVFLDVMMPPQTGFDLLRSFRTFPFMVIFITSYDKFALQAFRFSATDYLLKPVSPALLREAIGKMTLDVQKKHDSRNLETLLSWDQTGPYGSQTMVVPHHDGFEVINIKEIIMCEGDGYCTRVYLTDNRMVLSTRNLKHFDELLSTRNFLRIHQSYLINLYHVRSYNSHFSQVLLSDNHLAGVGNAFRNKFMAVFKGLS